MATSLEMQNATSGVRANFFETRRPYTRLDEIEGKKSLISMPAITCEPIWVSAFVCIDRPFKNRAHKAKGCSFFLAL